MVTVNLSQPAFSKQNSFGVAAGRLHTINSRQSQLFAGCILILEGWSACQNGSLPFRPPVKSTSSGLASRHLVQCQVNCMVEETCLVYHYHDVLVDLQGMQPRRKHKVNLPRSQLPTCIKQVQLKQAISTRCALLFSVSLLWALPSCAQPLCNTQAIEPAQPQK